jgi:Plavaka transposase
MLQDIFYSVQKLILLFNIQPFTNDFQRADIHELLAPDLLHQVIQGTFKDHIVKWVQDYLYITNDRGRADNILDDIDRR